VSATVSRRWERHAALPRAEKRLAFLFDGLQLVVLGLLPLLLTAFQLRALLRGADLAPDFTQGPWEAGHRLLSGASAYVPPSSSLLRQTTFVYPAPAALGLAPFALLPHASAALAFTLLNLAAVPATLRVLGVRDWRVYTVSLMWPPVMAGWETGNITLLLALGAALAWRYRDRPGAAGVLVACLVSAKLFLWPVALWLLATRRYRAFLGSLLSGLALNAVSWGVLGFNQLARYERDLTVLTRWQEKRGYSVIAGLTNHGVSRPLAYTVMVALTLLLCGACLWIGRRGDGRAAFALALAAGLVGTPISWLHYFALLLVTLALARPRLSLLWLVPLLLPFPTVGPTVAEMAATFAVLAAVTAVAAIPDRRAGHERSRCAATPAPQRN
jgi:hypothetical protein